MAASRRGQPPLAIHAMPDLSSSSPSLIDLAAARPAMGGGDGPSSSTPSLPGGVRHASQSTSSSSDVPYASALFLVVFDVKAGYTMTWRRTADAGAADLVEEDLLDASAAVEYKSLPSGLHEVAEDLVYFVHRGGRHAGLSAFVNRPTAEDGQRNARMLAVGVLVPLSYGRLGRAWRHAEGLREVAAKMAADMSDTSVLEKFWERIRPRRDETWDEQPATKDSPLDSPSLSFQRPMLRGHTRTRSASDGTALVPRGHRLTPYHPAWSLTSLLDTFGPLIFPIHRAALLRKRILISCHPPVHDICNYVYDISILSNIPTSVLDLLAPDAPSQRLRPLFTVGVLDIPFLTEDAAATAAARQRRQASSRQPSGSSAGLPSQYQGLAPMSFSASHSQVIVADDAPGNGWVACTTDSILASKDALFDVLITMPAARTYTTNRGKRTRRAWPIIVESSGPGGARGDRVRIRATQRDLRRFRALRAALARISPPTPPQQPQQSQPQPISADSKAPASTITTVTATDSSASPPPGRNHSPPSTPSPLRPLQRTTSSIALTAVTAATAAGTAVVHATAAAAAGLAGSGLLDAAVAGGDFAALDDPVAAEAGEPSSGVVEPSSWAALAYAGFMWWASAGEQGRRDEKSERIADERLLADLGVAAVGPVSPATVPRQVSRPGVSHSQGQQASGSGIDLGGGATARRGADTGTGSKAAGSGGGPGPSEAGTEADPAAAAELAIISYFHRLTTSMLGGASDLVLDADAGSGCSSSSSAASSAPLSPEGGSSDEERYRDFGGPDDDGDDDENAALLSGAAREEITAGDRRPGVRIDSDALTRLGLDVWSKADGIFARELIGTYFGRRAWVERKRLEVCGLRIC